MKIKPKYKFEEIQLTEKPEIETILEGMSSVTQDLKLKFKNPGGIYNDLVNIKKKGKGISILHISPNNEAYLYGEHEGLQIIEVTESTIILEGKEADTFFNIDFELANRIIDTLS
jgi:hypothetical protein